jgi:hypothetical protein
MLTGDELTERLWTRERPEREFRTCAKRPSADELHLAPAEGTGYTDAWCSPVLCSF